MPTGSTVRSLGLYSAKAIGIFAIKSQDSYPSIQGGKLLIKIKPLCL